MGRSPEARPEERDDEDEEEDDAPQASPRGVTSAEPAGHPYRMPGVLPKERVPKAPKNRTAITLAWATLGGLAVLGVVRAVASVPVQQPQQPPESKATTLVAQAPLPLSPPEVVMSPPAPSGMVAARAEEVTIAMALERKDYATVKTVLLPKIATLECDKLRVLRNACASSHDWKCLRTSAKALTACTVPRKGP